MSRMIVFAPNQLAVGELNTLVDRGWMLAGHPAVAGGGSTTLALTNDQASLNYLQFGRMVLIAHDRLPNWAGMLDTPWNFMPPVSVAAYNAEYVLSLRSPEAPITLSGSVGSIAAQMLDMFNRYDDLYVRIGDTHKADPTARTETLDGRNFWEQLTAIINRAGCELQTRPEKDASGRLVIYLDIATRLGIDTNFLYSDGPNGNATFSNGVLNGPIYNRVIGTGDESGAVSRLRSRPVLSEASSATYRMRSQTVQFRGVTELGTLQQYTQNYINYYATPKFSFLMNVLDKGDAFQNMRLGNTVLVHISQAYLPGGIQGVRGTARVLAMAYTEAQNLLTAKVELL